jgi:hydroxymethylpyrimidine/phosphomethylpyrimidine kinase
VRGVPNVLSIAGSDPSGGAGIQADLKTFSALGAYGMTVLTALTAQSTRGVTGVLPVAPEWVRAQIATLADDVRIDAVKIGMLGDAGVAEAVAAAVERYRWPVVVLDTVMVSKSGHRLLTPAAVDVVRERLLPLVDLVTPNLPEAADLLGEAEAPDEAHMVAQASRLLDLGARRVLLKGGHLPGTSESIDVLAEPGQQLLRLSAARVPTTNDHGTGCTLSAAIAALRPGADDWPSAVQGAKTYLSGALASAEVLDVGTGHGPVHHFWQVWEKAPRTG